MAKNEKIKEIIDFHLKRWIELGANRLPVIIEPEMADPNQNKKEEWQTWYPIFSKVTESDIEEFEKEIGHKLPVDYKTFLTYKHFYELHISQSVFQHPVKFWKSIQLELIFEGYPTEYLIEKGYLPFATWGDWGLLCFDTNRNNEEYNYPVILWDHDSNEQEDKYADFFDLLSNLDLEERETIYL